MIGRKKRLNQLVIFVRIQKSSLWQWLHVFLKTTPICLKVLRPQPKIIGTLKKFSKLFFPFGLLPKDDVEKSKFY